MEYKNPIKITGKAVITILIAILGALILEVDICMTMVWENLFMGVLIGLIGILLLLSLIPVCKGLK